MAGGSEGIAGQGDVSARPASADRSDRRRVITVSLALFVVTFLIYWLLGAGQTPYDFQLSQANNIVHGHLDMTEQYTHNLNILERVLYDGKGFCLPINDPRGAEYDALIPNPRFSADCKHYMQHSLGPAFMLVPLVLLFGPDINQTLISALLGGLTAVIVYAVARRFSSDRKTQLALTVMALFGTTFFFSASDGSVWHFAHTTAVMFLFAAIYATVNRRNALLAGAFIGAAFTCRPSVILAGFFPLVAFADMYLVNEPGVSLLRRIRLRPLISLALGVAPFLALTGLVNYLRFNNPFETGYNLSEQIYQVNDPGLAATYIHGIFDISYISRHIPVFFESMPVFSGQGPYVRPSWAGLALWVTSPALLLGLFVHLRHYRLAALLGAVALILAGAVMLIASFGQQMGLTTWSTASLPLGLHLLPFWVLIAAAITMAVGLRDRLAIACWAAIVPLVLADWLFAATGWAQFGYRYALDFMPFVWLLAAMAVPRLRWFHVVLISAAVLVNLWGVLWIQKFAQMHLFGWTWIGY
jgi:hypothetical protein